MTRYAWFVLLMLVAPSWRAQAQEPLTLDRAISAALINNASLRAARASGAEADAHVGEARSGFFPRLTLSESWQRSNQPVFVFSSLLAARQFGAANFAIDALNNPDPIGFFHGAVGVDQLIFDGGGQRAGTDAAARRRDIAGLATDEAAAAETHKSS